MLSRVGVRGSCSVGVRLSTGGVSLIVSGSGAGGVLVPDHLSL